MANWIGVITNAGATLLAGWAEGGTLNIDSAAAGTGTVAEAALPSRTALVQQKQVMSIVSASTITSGRRIKLQVTAPTTGYTLNQIGVWAKLGSGESTLLAIYQNATGVLIPSISESPEFTYTFFAMLSISTSGTLTLTIDPENLVTQDTLEDAIDDLNMGTASIASIGDGTIRGAISNIDSRLSGVSCKKISLSLPTASWLGSESPYYQVITITGATSNTKVDLQPDNTTITNMISSHCKALYIGNNSGTLTAYAVGYKPTADLTVQATYYEVTT